MLMNGSAVLLHSGHEVSVAGDRGLMLALAALLLFAAPVARADDGLTHSRATGDGAGSDRVRVQPTANQFAVPNQPDVSPSSARAIDELYRQLIGEKPTTSFGVNGATECLRCLRSTGGADARH
jgi:hypothetical protein